MNMESKEVALAGCLLHNRATTRALLFAFQSKCSLNLKEAALATIAVFLKIKG